ncbi:MFS transporter [Pseudoalteromonas sp. BDTF-M6]|uniref:MFS transporter n=1 Tax=Pseudoalteromonas sp. BDTF-M6 TaxID=2796132 RepID=UPI001BAF33BE|nr:MFS transporter [Pseudoalteromonas sp. BDTF-M6]MBS3798034.1 NarK/NasA family nitrate transporter [Pseudoalteromonas sp. BDTF-M6]
MSLYQANRALSIATLVFACNFAVWVVFAALGNELRQALGLSATEFGLLLAAPLISGSVLRWPVGYLLERFSARRLWLVQMALLLPSLIALDMVSSYGGYLAVGLWLGLAGCSFTIGLSYVSPWYDSAKQGTAMGVFGAGNAGAAVPLLLFPWLYDWSHGQYLGWLMLVIMLVVMVLFKFAAPKLPEAMKLPAMAPLKPWRERRLWLHGLYYYFVFGSYLALINWLPQYLMNAYGHSDNTAMLITALFILSSSMMRALGGWFADLYGAKAVNWGVFWVCLVCLFFLSYPPTSMTIHGIDKEVSFHIELPFIFFIALVFIMGIAQGFGRTAIFKDIRQHYPRQLPSASGFVAAIGALGGSSLLILFGIVEDLVGIYSASFMLLYGVLAACMVAMYLAQAGELKAQAYKQAVQDNFLR